MLEERKNLLELLKKKRIIAALCRESDLDDLLLSNVQIAFVLCGDMKNLPDIVEKIKKAKIHPFVYIDFIDGLSSNPGAVDFVKHYTKADGIVTTKSNQIKRAHSLKMMAIQRFFVFDAISMNNIRNQMANSVADAVEVLPGVIQTVIQTLSQGDMPLIVGGFVNSQKDVARAVDNGAVGITTSVPNLWYV